jgi:sugar-specific transcriptional regulator TrmB
LSVNKSNVEAVIVTELKISQDEAKAFLTLVYKGKMKPPQISETLAWDDDKRAHSAATSLMEKGMVIEINPCEFEALHPRFAITNRYRRRCQEDGMPFKKNVLIDNIGVLLEQPYEYARTK